MREDVVKNVPYMFTLKNYIHNNNKYHVFMTLLCINSNENNLRVKQLFKSIGTPSQIKDLF